jgi:hypothetical protein
MKNFFLAILFVSIAQFAVAQRGGDTTWQSHIDRFLDSPHTAVRTEQVDHGHVVDCYLQILTATDLITGKVLTGLHFADKAGYVVNVDGDEVPALRAAITLISSKIITSPPVNLAMVTFKSRSGFEAGCLTNRDGQWELFLQLKRDDNGSNTIMKKPDLDVFLKILNDVMDKL